MASKRAQKRLEYLRCELRAERISQGELLELQSLASHIEPGDVELLEAAGVPEFPEDAPEIDKAGPRLTRRSRAKVKDALREVSSTNQQLGRRRICRRPEQDCRQDHEAAAGSGPVVPEVVRPFLGARIVAGGTSHDSERDDIQRCRRRGRS